MEARRSRFDPVESAVAAVALAAAAIAAVLVVTLPRSESTAAGWRHLVYVSLLGAFALSATAPGSRRGVAPAQLFSAFQVAMVALTLALPWPKLPLLAALSALLAVGGLLTLALEALRGRERSPLQWLVLAVGLLAMVAIAPVFVIGELTGTLAPPL